MRETKQLPTTATVLKSRGEVSQRQDWDDLAPALMEFATGPAAFRQFPCGLRARARIEGSLR